MPRTTRRRQRSASPRPPPRDADGALPLTFPCDGFVVQIADPDPVRATHLARRALRDAVGTDAGWSVRPIGPGSRDVDLTPPPSWQPRTAGDAFQVARRLERTKGVEAAEPSFVGPGLAPPPERAAALGFGGEEDADPDPEWHLARVRAREAWAELGGASPGEGILVGHPDTGYTVHPEIWNPSDPHVRPELGYDCLEGDSDPLDDLRAGPLQSPGHGTSTASVIMSAPGGGSAGRMSVTGVAPGARLAPFRVSRSVVHLSMRNVTRAITLAAARRCRVVSMSLGGPLLSPALHRAVKDAVERGAILLAAAGNVWPWVVYPAAFDEVIAVAASDRRDRVWDLSATGPAVDVTAPGAGVWVADASVDSGYAVRASSGTSFAVATTAGVAALWLAKHGTDALAGRLGGEGQLAAAFRRIVMATARAPAGWKPDRWGAGIVDALAVLRADVAAPARARFATAVSRRPRGPKVPSPWAHYFPDLAPEAVADALGGMVRARLASPEADPSGLGAELAVHLAADPALRAAVSRAARGGPANRRARATASRAKGGALPPTLLTAASAELRAALGEG